MEGGQILQTGGIIERLRVFFEKNGEIKIDTSRNSVTALAGNWFDTPTVLFT